MKFLCSVIILMILLVGCSRTEDAIPVNLTSTPTPTPTPTPIPVLSSTKVVVVDELADVLESLILYNNTSNDFMRFMRGNGDIYELVGESRFHVSFVAAKQVALGLLIYKNALTNWTFPDNSYYDRLMELKKAELYKTQHFSALIEMMLNILPTENEEAIQSVRNKFSEWRKDSRNHEPIIIQNDILKELGINPDAVNFMYVISPEESEKKFDNPLNPNNSGFDGNL